jgi:hypothetical protein
MIHSVLEKACRELKVLILAAPSELPINTQALAAEEDSDRAKLLDQYD